MGKEECHVRHDYSKTAWLKCTVHGKRASHPAYRHLAGLVKPAGTVTKRDNAA